MKYLILLLSLLTFSVNAKHDIEKQIREFSSDIVNNCTQQFVGQALVLNHEIPFCETETDVIFYVPYLDWKTCIITSTLYTAAVNKYPGCVLLVVNNKQIEAIRRDLTLEFYKTGVALFIFKINVEEHEGIII